jgi:hypothetical protein
LDLPTELTLGPDQETAVAIGGAGSVGYRWTLEVRGDGDAIDASIRSFAPPPPQPGSTPFGGSLPHELVIRARRPGRAIVRLELSRPGRPPRDSHDIDVSVSD